jgi:cytoskeletal protein CcmA (bactofilin family)
MEIPTLINSSSKIKGELMFKSDVRIDGEVFGKIESDKFAIIGAEGYVKGFLRARDLVVFGRLEGNIVVSGTTILHAGSSIFGNLYTKGIEVNEGAIITARVITYDKLEAFDEAQIHLAEEMIRIQPVRRNSPHFSNDQISFDDEGSTNIGNHELTSPKKEGSAGPMLTASEHVPSGKIEEPTVKVVEMINVSSPAVASKVEEQNQNQSIRETESVRIQEIEVVRSKEMPSADRPTYEEESISFTAKQSISIASFLGEPVKVEETLSLRIGKKRPYKADANILPQALRKSKGISLIGFDELKSLLGQTKYPEMQPAIKKNGQVKANITKSVDNELIIRANGSEKGKFSLNDAISQLPIEDYSSLFR